MATSQSLTPDDFRGAELLQDRFDHDRAHESQREAWPNGVVMVASALQLFSSLTRSAATPVWLALPLVE